METSRNDSRFAAWLALVLGIIAAKATWFAFDSTAMLFMGDSESYLKTAIVGWIPPDRSFLYGFILRPAAVRWHSLYPLLFVQCMIDVAAALVLAWLLRRHFGVSQHLALTLAALWAIAEPLSQLLERYVMTETFALITFAAFLVCGLQFLETRRIRWLVAAHLASTLAVAFRSVYIPVSLASAIILPAIAFYGSHESSKVVTRSARQSFWIAVAVSVASVVLFHQIYKVSYGQLAGRPPAYQNADGFFLLAAWAPLVTPEDFPDRQIGRDVIDHTDCNLRDRQSRASARWQQGCLIDVLIKRIGSDYRANILARTVARHILVRAPLEVTRLVLLTWKDYLTVQDVTLAAHSDRGEEPLPSRVADVLQQRLGVVDAEQIPFVSTPTNRWFFAATGWYIALACIPLMVLKAIVAAPRSIRPQMLFVAAVTLILFGCTLAGSLRPTPRFLHPFAWLLAIPLSVFIMRLGRVPTATAFSPKPAARTRYT